MSVLFRVIAAIAVLGAGIYTYTTTMPPSSSPSISKQAAPQSIEDISIRLPIPVVDMAFAPYYVAADQGLFKAQGLNTEIKPGGPEVDPVKMLAAGTDKFGVLGGPELLIRARERGVPLVAVAQIHKDSDFVVLLTGANSGITKVEQLADKDVGLFYGHVSSDVLRILFKKVGVAVKEQDVGFNYSKLIAGQLPAQWGFRTTAGLALPAQGFQINMISPKDSGVRTQGHILVTTEAMIKDRPELVQRMVSGVIAGMQATLKDAPAAIAAAQKRDAKLNEGVAKAQQAIYSDAMTRNVRLGALSVDDFKQSIEQMATIGVNPGVDAAKIIDNRFVDAFYKKSAPN
jgi:NitT/TauT family transport system substrate-binding protein